MAMNAASKYVNEDATEERTLKVSAEAGRKCVRSIQNHPILSREWIALSDALNTLTKIVKVEGQMQPDSKVAEIVGRDKECGGTLWDQDVHENAIKILVEEAKVNLSLRMMQDYKKWQYDAAQKSATLDEASRVLGCNQAQLEAKCHQFEECLGQLLARAFAHVEALQLMDVPLLIEHISMILDHCDRVLKESLGCSAKDQEIAVMYYFASLMKHSESLNNPELLAKTRELRLVKLATSHILSHAATEYPEDASLAVAGGLAAMADNEDFRTEWEEFFQDADGVFDTQQCDQFLQLQDFIAPILEKHPDKKRELRPLTDFFNVVRRKVGS
mmetsp:Transcript_131649/g.421164  ORF Transcript_131649/g.421164 Transcript_131649/m.421164 type:complete len:330 (+) Transcript_131649:51-1040(+)